MGICTDDSLCYKAETIVKQLYSNKDVKKKKKKEWVGRIQEASEGGRAAFLIEWAGVCVRVCVCR